MASVFSIIHLLIISLILLALFHIIPVYIAGIVLNSISTGAPALGQETLFNNGL